MDDVKVAKYSYAVKENLYRLLTHSRSAGKNNPVI